MSSFNNKLRPPSAEVEYTPGCARVRFAVPENFLFCQGHFPGQPLVPGAVIAGWMMEAAELAGLDISSGSLSNLKFHDALSPGDPVTVTAEAGETGTARLAVRSQERLCADAVLFA